MASKVAQSLARKAYIRAKKKYQPGQGGRFKALTKSIGARQGVKNPAAVAAWIGRKKYGQKQMTKWSVAGRKV